MPSRTADVRVFWCTKNQPISATAKRAVRNTSMVAPTSTAEIPDSVWHGDISFRKDLIKLFIGEPSCMWTHYPSPCCVCHRGCLTNKDKFKDIGNLLENPFQF